MQAASIQRWRNLSLIAFLIVAVLGFLMRYKIAYSFPWLSQKFLQHAHSHFAFSGWVSQGLFILFYWMLFRNTGNEKNRQLWLGLNVLNAFAMLVSFSISGYSPVSIVFSTLSIVIQGVLAVDVWKHANRVHSAATPWIKAAIVFYFLSIAGTASLSIMMATSKLRLDVYLSSLYWYLHFQYNGWFQFALIGLLVQRFYTASLRLPFLLLSLSCVPAVGLSVLWLNLPTWVYLLVFISALCQLLGWILLMLKLAGPIARSPQHWVVRCLALTGLTALSVKFLLQTASVHPELSHLAFGFRPVVIAYLHLVLLTGVSVLILYLMALEGWFNPQKTTALLILLLALVLNQLGLGLQAIGSFSHIPMPNLQPVLVWISAGIIMSLLVVFLSHFRYRGDADTE